MKKTLAIILALTAVLLFTCSCGSQNAYIKSAQITCDANGNVVETVEFAYESATIAYTPIADDGSVGTTVTETISVHP